VTGLLMRAYSSLWVREPSNCYETLSKRSKTEGLRRAVAHVRGLRAPEVTAACLFTKPIPPVHYGDAILWKMPRQER
jgi:hypothetical protein